MNLSRKEKTLLVAIIAVLVAAGVWHILSVYVIPQIEFNREREEARSLQTTIEEGTTFTIKGRLHSSDETEIEVDADSSWFEGTISVRVESSRLYGSKTAMEEAEGFEVGNNGIESSVDGEPLGLVVDVSISNIDVSNTAYEGFLDRPVTFFDMELFNINVGDTASLMSYFAGQDMHVPEAELPVPEGGIFHSVVDVPQGETVTVRLAFLIPPASAKDEPGMLGQFVPKYEEGERIYFYYGSMSYSSGDIENLWSIGGELEATSFADAAAYIPYLVELSPQVMWDE